MFRNYNNNSIEEFYKNMYIYQTLKKKNLICNTLKYNTPLCINDAIYYLNKVVDTSDPDTEHPQIYHGYQTAESIKSNYFINNKLIDIDIRSLFSDTEWNSLPSTYQTIYDTTINELYNHIYDWSWLPLIGLIHDLGKILVLPEFGYFPEYFSVGDIYPLGCKFQNSNIYYEKKYHELCEDFKNTSYQSENGIYKTHCGFESLTMTFSHDYYLYNVLLRTCHILPPEALYIIRFHSFYAWHTPHNNIRSYTNLANKLDWINLPLLKLFQKTDLYSKHNTLPVISKLEDYYNNLINKFIQGPLYF